MYTLSDNFIEIVMDNFFMEPRFIRTYRTDKDRKEVSRQIKPAQIRSHFNGDFYIGYVVRKSKVNFFVFDLDCHNQNSQYYLADRFDVITKKFGRPHMLAASPNRGMHLYYLLTENHYPSHIKSILSKHTDLKKGFIELFPGNNGIRLFGGRKCDLMDYDFNIIAKGISDIEEYFINVWECAEDRINLNDFIDSRKSKTNNAPDKLQSEVEDLIEYGLSLPSSRNDSLLKINFHLQTNEGYSQSESEKFMINWIEKKNNGLSKDWKNHPDIVRKHIHEIAFRYDSSKIAGSKNFPISELTSDELSNIKQTADHLSSKFPINQKRTEEFLTDLVAFCKQNMKDGQIMIPKGVFQKCKNGYRANYLKYKDALLKSGILQIVKNYSKQSGKCACYRLIDGILKKGSTDIKCVAVNK